MPTSGLFLSWALPGFMFIGDRLGKSNIDLLSSGSSTGQDALKVQYRGHILHEISSDPNLHGNCVDLQLLLPNSQAVSAGLVSINENVAFQLIGSLETNWGRVGDVFDKLSGGMRRKRLLQR